MIRYLRQRDQHSCIPTAIVNVRKWLGQQATHKDVATLARKYRVSEYQGMSVLELTIALEFVANLKTTRLKSFTHRVAFDRCLQAGKILLLIVEGHCFLVVEQQQDKYKAINLFKEETESWITWSWLETRLTERAKLLHPSILTALVIEATNESN